MAGCYHDQEEFESDMTIEVAREGDILKEGQELKRQKCKKNPGHRGFIPFKDLTLEHLPSKYRNTETLDKIKQKGSRVVRLVVRRNLESGCVHRNRGSGCVYRINNQYYIMTNNHVVKTEDELKRCTVEFHYDDDSRSSVEKCRGVKLVTTCPYRDRTLFTFHPVPDFLHQLDYENNRYAYVNIMFKNNQIKSSRAFPSSSDSYLSPLNLNSSDNYLMFISYPDGSIGFINSCYFTFQPTPSNIQELTSVEVYIDEDDGKSGKIRGDIVKLGDDFIVRVQDGITQDKVKKCRVVWNGKVIGCGTRLYFKQCKLKDAYNVSGIDEDRCDDDVWEFNFHPKKVSECRTVSEDVCCIGHPHGAIKHITFGRDLGRSLEKFDNQYRRIKDSRPDCQCIEVNCFNYSCKTCPGSSGSPVIELWNLDDDLYRTHFMGERVKRVINGEQIENINIAWLPGVDMNRMIDERVMNLMKKATRKFEAKIPVAIVSIFNSSDERSNEEAINLMGQYIRELEAKIAVVTASITNSSGEENNEEKINNQLKQAMREFEAKILVAIACIFNSSGERSNEEANNLMRQAISELEAEIAVAAAIAVDRSYFKPF